MYFKTKAKVIWSALQIEQMSQICISYQGPTKLHGTEEFHAISASSFGLCVTVCHFNKATDPQVVFQGFPHGER